MSLDHAPEWTARDDDDLRAAYAAGGDDLAVRLFEGRRPPPDVIQRGIALGLQRGRPWDQESLLRLLRTEGDPTALRALAVALGRTYRSVLERYRRLHRAPREPKKTNPRGRVAWWDEACLEWMRNHYAQSTAEQIRERFPDRSLAAVRIRASEMGLTLPRPKAIRLARKRAANGSRGPRA